MPNKKQLQLELQHARRLWGAVSPSARITFLSLASKHHFSVLAGDLLLIEGHWYVTHTGLLSLAKRNGCWGIRVEPVSRFCDFASATYAFKATVFKSRMCRGFNGYGDASPANISPLVKGSELRIAETRAVSRALRKAYGVGICCIEEIGNPEMRQPTQYAVRRLPPESSNRNNGHGGNGNGRRVRDRLCQIIRQHKLDAELVKSYAVDFCGTKSLREATREQVENFVTHLADWAAKDRNALLCQLNSYRHEKAGAA